MGAFLVLLEHEKTLHEYLGTAAKQATLDFMAHANRFNFSQAASDACRLRENARGGVRAGGQKAQQAIVNRLVTPPAGSPLFYKETRVYPKAVPASVVPYGAAGPLSAEPPPLPAGTLSLSSVRFPLRPRIRQLVLDPLAPAGTYPYLDDAPAEAGGGGAAAAAAVGVGIDAIGRAAHCNCVTCSRPVLLAAAKAHKWWKDSAEKPLIEAWALANGYEKVVLCPFGLHVEEDATDVSRRKSEDVLQLRPLLKPHVINNPRFITVLGVVKKPVWLEKNHGPSSPQAAWAHDAYLNSVAEGFGLRELSEWDTAGPLLTSSFPGLEIQPPAGKKWLFCISPFLVGVIGDLESFYHLFEVTDQRCPWCTVPKVSQSAGAADPLRSKPEIAAAILGHRETILNPAASQTEKKAAGRDLAVWGVKPTLIRNIFEQLSLTATWRLPHTTGASIYDYYVLDILHVFNQGVVVRAIGIFFNAVKLHGDFDRFNRNFILLGDAFGDGVRRRVSLHGGLKMSLKAQKGDTNYSMLRCMVAALDAAALSSGNLRQRLIRFGEFILFAHRVANCASGPLQRKHLADVVLPWLCSADCMQLGEFDFDDDTKHPRNLSFPKYHIMLEIPRLLQLWGCHLNFASMSAFEAGHPDVKDIFRHVSRAAAARLPQFLRLAALRYLFRFVVPLFCPTARDAGRPPPRPPADSVTVSARKSPLPPSLAAMLTAPAAAAGCALAGAMVVAVENLLRARHGVAVHDAPVLEGDLLCVEGLEPLLELRVVLESAGQLFYVGREWAASKTHGELHNVFSRGAAGAFRVGRLSAVLGRAWVYTRDGEAIFARQLERYAYV